MNKLQELLESNAELKAKIEAMNKDPKATVADFIAMAKEYGVELIEADLQPTPAGGEISDSELEAVAGGGKCVCVAGGGGTGDKYHDTCACVAAGMGFGKITDEGIGCDCGCPVVGTGKSGVH